MVHLAQVTMLGGEARPTPEAQSGPLVECLTSTDPPLGSWMVPMAMEHRTRCSGEANISCHHWVLQWRPGINLPCICSIKNKVKITFYDRLIYGNEVSVHKNFSGQVPQTHQICVFAFSAQDIRI